MSTLYNFFKSSLFGIYLRTLLVVFGIFQTSTSESFLFIHMSLLFTNKLFSPTSYIKSSFVILPPIKGIKTKESLLTFITFPG